MFKKKLIALATVAAMLASATNVNAQDTGYAYSDAADTTNLAPAIAIGTIAVVAIIAVAVQNSSGHHHGH